jgi:hypothetical protein
MKRKKTDPKYKMEIAKIESRHVLLMISDSKKNKKKACVETSLGAHTLYKNCGM